MPAPIGQTCPDIDACIKRIESLSRDLGKVNCKNSAEVEDAIHDVDWELGKIIDELESLRNDNQSLRVWGEEMEKQKEDLEDALAKYEKQLSSMQDELGAVAHNSYL